MTAWELIAVKALDGVSMRIASRGKRFRNDLLYLLETDKNLKLTRGQALYLWKLVHLYRRQIDNEDLKAFAESAVLTDALPEIYKGDDHREKKVREHVPTRRTNQRSKDGNHRTERSSAIENPKLPFV